MAMRIALAKASRKRHNVADDLWRKTQNSSGRSAGSKDGIAAVLDTRRVFKQLGPCPFPDAPPPGQITSLWTKAFNSAFVLMPDPPKEADELALQSAWYSRA